MHAIVNNESTNSWFVEISNQLQHVCDVLTSLPAFYDFHQSMKQIIIAQSGTDTRKGVLGSYLPYKQQITLFGDRIESIPEAVYVFLHEFCHHVAEMKTGSDPDYCAISQNKAYAKEELRADCLALALIRKHFDENVFSKVIKMAKQRIKQMQRIFRGERIDSWTYLTYQWEYCGSNSNYALAA